MKTHKLLVMVSIALVTIIMLNSWQLISAYQSSSKWPTNNASFRYDSALPSSFHSATTFGANVWSNVSTSSWSWVKVSTSNNLIRRGYVDGTVDGYIAWTNYWYHSNGDIRNIRITYDSLENWYVGSGSPSSNQYDLRSVATHEFGHALGLLHTQPMPHCPGNSADATMCHSLSPGTTHWRSLQGDDQGGVASLYPW